MRNIFFVLTNIFVPIFYLFIAYGTFQETDKTLKGRPYRKIVRTFIGVGFILVTPFIFYYFWFSQI